MNKNNDVRRTLLLKGIWQAARPFLWYGFFIAVILIYVVFGKYEVRFTHILVYVALAAIIFTPLAAGWVSSAARVSAFSGKVEKIEKKREVVGDFVVRKPNEDSYHILTITFTVRDKNGKLHRFPIREPSFADIDYIKTGDAVKHRWGSKYLEKMSKSGDRDVLCIVCGAMNRMECNICYNCRRSLIKHSEYFD